VLVSLPADAPRRLRQDPAAPRPRLSSRTPEDGGDREGLREIGSALEAHGLIGKMSVFTKSALPVDWPGTSRHEEFQKWRASELWNLWKILVPSLGISVRRRAHNDLS
jgi:hypothetical protein